MEDNTAVASWDEFYGSSATNSSEDLVPTLMDIFDAMIAGSSGTPPPLSTTSTAHRHFPVLKIVEPGDPDGPSNVGVVVRSSCGSRAGSGGGGVVCPSSTVVSDPPPTPLVEDSLRPMDSSSSGPLPSSPNRRGAARISNDPLRHSGDSGDSGLSSPGPPGSSSSSSSSSSCSSSSAPGGPSYMDRVVMEVIESEQTYVRDLQQVVQGYFHHWRDVEENHQLTLDQTSSLFGNIEDILNFNSHFLGQLQSCGLDPVQVARCFVRNNTGFTIYTDYCTHYPKKVAVLTELMRNEAASRACRERQTALQHTLPLGSYLLKPVQRILKYHLLLQNIVKHCPERTRNSAGYSDIIVALSAMTGIAHHINDMKRKHEHAVRVQEVQSLLDGWPGEDLTTFGELVAEGSFRMYGAKAPRHVFLLDRMLLIVKRKDDGTLGYKTHILCSNLMLIESVPGEPLSFHVIPFNNPRQQYTLEARNLEQKREWALQLKRVILENYEAVIPHHARQLVLQLGQNNDPSNVHRSNSCSSQDRTDTYGYHPPPHCNDYTPPSSNSSSMGVKRHQAHSAPEYLERRKHSAGAAGRSPRKSGRTSSPRESPLLPRRLLLRKSDRSVSRDRQHPELERKHSSQSCSSAETAKSTKGAARKLIGAWRRRSEPCRNGQTGSSPSKNLSNPVESTTLPEEVMDDGHHQPEEEELNETAAAAPPSKIPESLERIVEQLVLQNIEIQRILQRKNKRRRRPMARPAGANRNSQSIAASAVDEGIYDSLIQVSVDPLSLAAESLSDAEGDYVTIRPDEEEEGAPDGTGHFSRCALRRSTACEPSTQFQQRATLSRSLSCPARGQPSRFVNRAAAAPSSASGKNKASAVSGKIHKLLNQIGSPEQWSSWIQRSLSPPKSDPINKRHDETDAESSPCVPSVWLRMQSEHLAEPGKKSGSLPRSFNTPVEGPSNKSRWTDRPVTIASDRPAPIDALELYLRSQQENCTASSSRSESTYTGLDDSLTDIGGQMNDGAIPAGVSDDNIHIHPEYKIYRRRSSSSAASKASSLMAILSSFSAKLTHHLKGGSHGVGSVGGGATSASSDFSWGSLFSLSQDGSSTTNPSAPSSSPGNRILHYLTRQYAALLVKQRSECSASSSMAAAIGARMAGAADLSDYATLKFVRTTPSCYSTSSRSDLSSAKSTASLSSKTTWYGTLESTRDAAMQMMMMDDSDEDESDQEDGASSTDSFFYERAFEAVEQLLDEAAAAGEWASSGGYCRDSVMFCDDGPITSKDLLSTKPPTSSTRSMSNQHRKPRSVAILERVKSLERKTSDPGNSPGLPSTCSPSLENLKSICQRRSELKQAAAIMSSKQGDESETSSQHSTSTVNTVVETIPTDSTRLQVNPAHQQNQVVAHPLPKGWVKHIIGKLQGESK